MIDIESIAGFYYMNHILDKTVTLEEDFAMLFTWSKETTLTALYLREWRNLNIADFKTDNNTMKTAIDKLYERSITLQDMLDFAHKHFSLLIEVRENAVTGHDFFD